ncbi:MBL fold metallo-hydrolase [Streptomyces sp. GC420]|uniref:MBL fold metallo-hydrolase n=1 Tax=Streptomyces sp. GC420 TaxID=2697568 RepID=UPI0037D9A1D0
MNEVDAVGDADEGVFAHDPHSSGELPEAGVLVSGDALVSGHPTSPTRGPQLLPEMFDKDRERTRASLDIMERVAADVLLPGHGPLHRGPVREAARRARDLAS